MIIKRILSIMFAVLTLTAVACNSGGSSGKSGGVTAVVLNTTEASIQINGTPLELKGTIMPHNAANQNVSWSTSDEKIATVTQAGVVTGVAVGKATITVTSEDGGFFDNCAVTVTPAAAGTPVTAVSLSPSTATIEIGNTTQLTATITPADATTKDITWSSGNPTIATVSSGVVTGVAAGTTTITVTTSDGNKTATCDVTVTDPADPVDPVVPVSTGEQGVINPEFKFWLDGTSSTANWGYCGTIYKTGFVGSHGECKKLDHPLGEVSSNGYILTSYCSDFIYPGSLPEDYYQKVVYIPSVKSYAGKTVAIRVKARTPGSTGRYIGIRLDRYYGTGDTPLGTPSKPDGVHGKRIALTSAWAEHTITLQIPPITGKIIGANNDDFLALIIIYDSGSIADGLFDAPIGHQEGTFDLALVTINEGTIALPYVPRDDSEELALIGQTYENDYPTGAYPGQNLGVSEWHIHSAISSWLLSDTNIYFTYPKRNCSYSVTFYSTTGAKNYIRNYTAGTDLLAVGFAQCFTPNSFRVNGCNTLTTGHDYCFFTEINCRY
jgi:hypothetical protein